MNNTHILLVLAVALIAIGMCAGFGIAAIVSPSHAEPTIEELAERAECNGIELLHMARECEQLAATAETRPDRRRYRRWAGELRRCACDHLQCINAIHHGEACVAPAQAVSHG
jgi:hypothetical protein